MVGPVALWVWLVAQAVAPPRVPPEPSWSSELNLKSLESIDGALAAPFPDQADWEVTFEDGTTRVIRSCTDFLAATRSRFDAGTEHDWSTLRATGSRCLALDALKAAKASRASFLEWFTFTPGGIAKLPASMGMLWDPESGRAARRAERACKPWGKYDPTLKVTVETSDRARLRSDGWSGRLVLYARADFDGDGVEDLLLRRDAHVEQGSASDSSVFVVTQTSARRCMRVVRELGPRR